MRTIVEIPAGQLEALDALCRHEGISRAEAIRRSLAAYLPRARGSASQAAFGLWKHRKVDSLAYERRLRREWNRDARR